MPLTNAAFFTDSVVSEQLLSDAAAGDVKITGDIDIGGSIICGSNSSGTIKINNRTFTSDADADDSSNCGIVTFDSLNTRNISIYGNNELRLHDDTIDKRYIGLRSHAASINHTLTMPSQLGSANQYLMTDASGNLSWNSISSATSPKQSCKFATNAALSGTYTYSNGSGGVGATFTNNSTGAITIDGQSLTLNDRVLVKNQSDAEHNGIYTVTTVGAGGMSSSALVLTRATDYDTPGEATHGSFTYIENGSSNSNKTFINTTSSSITIGTTELNFSQFDDIPIPINSKIISLFKRRQAFPIFTGTFIHAIQ